MSLNPTYSAPASFAAFAAAPSAKTKTRPCLPLPCGNGQVPRTIWSDCFGSTPSRNESVTVWSNFVAGIDLSALTASGRRYDFFRSTFSRAARKRLLDFVAIDLEQLWRHGIDYPVSCG